MELTQDLVRELLDADYEAGTLTWKHNPEKPKWWNTRYAGQPAFNAVHSQDYRYGKIRDKKYRRARIIFLHYHGWLPEEIDHINGVPNDDRIANLQPSTPAQNKKNRAKFKNNTTGVTGLYQRKNGRWAAQVGRNGYIGTFATKEEAEQAAIARRKELGYSERHGT